MEPKDQAAFGPSIVLGLGLDAKHEDRIRAKAYEGAGADALWRVFSAENAELLATLPFDPGTVELASEGDQRASEELDESNA